MGREQVRPKSYNANLKYVWPEKRYRFSQSSQKGCSQQSTQTIPEYAPISHSDKWARAARANEESLIRTTRACDWAVSSTPIFQAVQR